MHSREERWIQWWCAPWQWAHPDWFEGLFEGGALTAEQRQTLLLTRHREFLMGVGIAPSQPPEPVDPLLQWLQLDVDQQRLALALAGRICLAQLTPAMTDEQAAHEAWCRSVAKALRPGLWLAPGASDARWLLAAWTGDACWSRLRLSWPPDELASDPFDMPLNKLQTLWHSVLWRVTRAPSQPA